MMNLRVFLVVSLMKICWANAPSENPPMLTHALMDVGNIISIVIPESPDENINVEQLTEEFRQKLERIKKQNRASKVEPGLVTLKRVLPEMSREEKRMSLPLIRRMLSRKRVSGNAALKNSSRVEKTQLSGSTVVIPVERIYRDYEEARNRETPSVEAYRQRGNERSYGNYEGDRVIRRNEEIRREEANNNDGEAPSRQSRERIVFPDEDEVSRMTSSGGLREWSNNWATARRDFDGSYGRETSTECNYKLGDRDSLGKEPRDVVRSAEAVFESGGYDRAVRVEQFRGGGEEPSVDYSEMERRVAVGYPFYRGYESTENIKRSSEDSFGGGELADFVNNPDANEAFNQNSVKRNASGGSSKDRGFDKEPEVAKFGEGGGEFERISQEIREASGVNGSRLEASEDDYDSGKKDSRRAIKSPQGSDTPLHGYRYSDNSSASEAKGAGNPYEIFGNRYVDPALNYFHRDELDDDGKSRRFRSYGSSGRVGGSLRGVRRAIDADETLDEVGKPRERDGEGRMF